MGATRRVGAPPGFLVSHSSNSQTGFLWPAATSATVPAPPGVASGDLLLAMLCTGTASGGPGAITVPAGWTQVGAQTFNVLQINVYTKTAGGAEPASYTWTWVNSGLFFLPVCDFRKASASPLDGTTPLFADAAAPSTTLVAPSATPTKINDYCLALAFERQNTDVWSCVSTGYQTLETGDASKGGGVPPAPSMALLVGRQLTTGSPTGPIAFATQGGQDNIGATILIAHL